VKISSNVVIYLSFYGNFEGLQELSSQDNVSNIDFCNLCKNIAFELEFVSGPAAVVFNFA
jgi:hypothetical protein